jgi:hypothetical protein
MIPDIFLPAVETFVVYGLFDRQEPLQLRYIGQTILMPYERLKQHARGNDPFNPRKTQWIKEIGRSRLGMRVQEVYPIAPLSQRKIAETKWINFWKNYCDLLNGVCNPNNPSGNLNKRYKIKDYWDIY